MKAFLAALLASVAIPCAAADFKVDGNKIYVLGTLEAYDDANFEQAINDYNGHAMVILHSGGGYLRPAYAIGRSIRKHGWDTHTEYRCTSACAMIFLAGENLSIAWGGKVGFHSAVDPTTQKPSVAGNASN